jgi:hypothetical protein
MDAAQLVDFGQRGWPNSGDMSGLIAFAGRHHVSQQPVKPGIALAAELRWAMTGTLVTHRPKFKHSSGLQQGQSKALRICFFDCL